MKPNNKYLAPVKTRSSVINKLDRILRNDGRNIRDIFAAAGVTANNYGNWKRGTHSPSLISLESIAQVVGYRVVLLPDEEFMDEAIRFKKTS